MKLHKYGLLSFFRREKRLLPKIIIIVYIISFSIASYNHIVPFLQGGLFVYQKMNPDVPFWLDIYWTSLSVIDLLAIVVLCMNIPLGMILYLLVITSDVIINYSFVISRYGVRAVINLFQLGQLGFLLFMVSTYPFMHSLKFFMHANRKKHCHDSC